MTGWPLINLPDMSGGMFLKSMGFVSHNRLEKGPLEDAWKGEKLEDDRRSQLVFFTWQILPARNEAQYVAVFLVSQEKKAGVQLSSQPNLCPPRDADLTILCGDENHSHWTFSRRI